MLKGGEEKWDGPTYLRDHAMRGEGGGGGSCCVCGDR